MKPWTEERLLKAAYHHLGRYATNRAGLSRVLARKLRRASDGAPLSDDDAQMIARIVERCERLGLIDEAAYAQARVAALRRQGKGARLIRQDLGARGVDPALIDESLADPDRVAEIDAALRLAQRKKIGPYGTRSTDPAAERRILAAFARAGIDYGLARQVMDAESEEAVRAQVSASSA